MMMLKNTNYNPDVLTCLANLSNDEVFKVSAFWVGDYGVDGVVVAAECVLLEGGEWEVFGMFGF